MQDPGDWRLKAGGVIPLKHVSRSGGLGPEDATATDVVIIRASDLAAFAAYCFPETYAGLGTVIYPRRRSLPGFPALVVKHLDWEEFTEGMPVDPFGGDPAAPAGTYGSCVRVTIRYGTSPENDQEPDPSDPLTFLEVSASSSGTFLSEAVSGKAYWDQSGPTETGGNAVSRPDIPQTAIENTIEWNVRWPQIPYQFFDDTVIARLRARQGKVNATPMRMFNDAPAETILYLGHSISEQYSWREGHTGKSPISLDMKFLEKGFMYDNPLPGMNPQTVQVTHNHFYDKDNNWWRRLYINEAPPYATADLQAIWGES